MIKLGSKVKDFVTEFEGIAIARCVYLNNCIRIEVQPKGLTKDGKVFDSTWIDEGQLVNIPDEKVKAHKEEVVGGPGNIPSEISHP